MNLKEQITQYMENLSGKEKLRLSLGLVMIIILTIGLSYFSFSPNYAILFNQLRLEDAHQIVRVLEEQHIPYKIQNGGSDILIDKNKVASTRLKIMGSTMKLQGNLGFELFDKNDFGMTDFSQKINYQRALQGELERTIGSLEEINKVRVHLVIPETHLFTQEENEPKAAVSLQVEKPLSERQILSIQQLITASVPKLIAEHVVIVDQNGMLLGKDTENDSAHFKAKQAIEQYLNHKVSQILYSIFPKNQVAVKIDASVNYDEIQRELVKPYATAQVSHEKESNHSSTEKTKNDKIQTDSSKEKSYQLGSEKELFKRASGTIEHLSISVVVPKNTPKHRITQIQNLVESAVGYNKTRGDIIHVEALIIPPPQKSSHKHPKTQALTQPPSFHPGPSIIYFIVPMGFMAVTGVLLLERKRKKTRQLLLTELSEWLEHHEL